MGMGDDSPPNLENLPFHRAKMVVQYIYAGQLTGPRTILSITVTKKERSHKILPGQTSDTKVSLMHYKV